MVNRTVIELQDSSEGDSSAKECVPSSDVEENEGRGECAYISVHNVWFESHGYEGLTNIQPKSLVQWQRALFVQGELSLRM
jgi:hypothetical protein